MSSIEDYIRQHMGVPIENALGGKPQIMPQQGLPQGNIKPELAEYWRQNVSTPPNLPQQNAQQPQINPKFQQHLEELHQNIDPEILQNPPPRFQGLKQKIETQKPIDSSDIRKAIKPNEALSDEQMQELDKTRGQAEKAGREEGDYGA